MGRRENARERINGTMGPRLMLGLLALLVVTRSALAQQDGVVSGVERRFACWGGFGPPVVSAQCPRGTVLKVLRAGLRVKTRPSKACVYRESDCGCELGEAGCNMPNVAAMCTGRAACRLDVTQQYIHNSQCKGFSDYMYIDFNCVQASPSESADRSICEAGTTEGSDGYLVSPAYPGPYPAGAACECTVSTTPSSTVVLDVLDFNVNDRRCEKDFVTLAYGKYSRQLCGDSNGMVNHINTRAQAVTIAFRSDADGSANGFAIKYQARPAARIRVSCGSPPSGPVSLPSASQPHKATVSAPQPPRLSKPQPMSNQLASQDQANLNGGFPPRGQVDPEPRLLPASDMMKEIPKAGPEQGIASRRASDIALNATEEKSLENEVLLEDITPKQPQALIMADKRRWPQPTPQPSIDEVLEEQNDKPAVLNELLLKGPILDDPRSGGREKRMRPDNDLTEEYYYDDEDLHLNDVGNSPFIVEQEPVMPNYPSMGQSPPEESGLSKAQLRKLRLIKAQISIIKKKLSGVNEANAMAEAAERDTASSVSLIKDSVKDLPGRESNNVPSNNFQGNNMLDPPMMMPNPGSENMLPGMMNQNNIMPNNLGPSNMDTGPMGSMGSGGMMRGNRPLPERDLTPSNREPAMSPMFPGAPQGGIGFDAANSALYPELEQRFQPEPHQPPQLPRPEPKEAEPPMSKRLAALLLLAKMHNRGANMNNINRLAPMGDLLATTSPPMNSLSTVALGMDEREEESEEEEDITVKRRKVKIIRKKKIQRTTPLPSSESEEEIPRGQRVKGKGRRMRHKFKNNDSEEDESEEAVLPPPPANKIEREGMIRRFGPRIDQERRQQTLAPIQNRRPPPRQPNIHDRHKWGEPKEIENKMRAIYNMGQTVPSPRHYTPRPNYHHNSVSRSPPPHFRTEFPPKPRPMMPHGGPVLRHMPPPPPPGAVRVGQQQPLANSHAEAQPPARDPVGSRSEERPPQDEKQDAVEEDNSIHVMAGVGSVVVVVVIALVVGLAVRHVMAKRERETAAMRQRHKRECAMRRNLQQQQAARQAGSAPPGPAAHKL